MPGHVVRLGDLAPYSGGSSLWHRIVVVLFSDPGRVWTYSDLNDRVYADDPDGGPLTSSIRTTIYKNRRDLPRGWHLHTVSRGYQLRQVPPKPGARLYDRLFRDAGAEARA